MLVKTSIAPLYAARSGACQLAASLRSRELGARWPDAASGERGWAPALVIGLLLIHLPLALLMNKLSVMAGVHALATLAWGLVTCVRGGKILALAQWVAYVAGAEVLWRMCRAPIPWEFAKLSVALVSLIFLLRAGRVPNAWLPACYFGLLIPGGLMTFFQLPLDEARQQVSFTLAGPLCLALCAIGFSSLRLTVARFQQIGIMLLGPVAGIAFLALFKLATTEVEFSSGSNFAGSGGYGPNQVSAVLGLGALLSVFLYVPEKRSRVLRIGFALLTLWLLGQAAMTFSRTGLYLFVAGFLVAVLFLAQWHGKRRRVLMLMTVLGAIGCAVLPMLDAFTGGMLAERFNDTGLTGRDAIAKMDLAIWLQHPVLGVGAGVSTSYRGAAGDDHAAHTEYTRLLADHGLLGLGALVVLLAMTARAVRSARGPWAKGLVCGLAICAFLFLAVSAMRLLIAPLFLGFIQARFLSDGSPSESVAAGSSHSGTTGPARRPMFQRKGGKLIHGLGGPVGFGIRASE